MNASENNPSGVIAETLFFSSWQEQLNVLASTELSKPYDPVDLSQSIKRKKQIRDMPAYHLDHFVGKKAESIDLTYQIIH